MNRKASFGLALVERVMERTLKTDTCWTWIGTEGGNGYGSISINGRGARVHRVVYEALVGPIPSGLTLDHLCRNRRCVNPAHLEPCTTRENTLRGVGGPAINARKTHCLRGHPLNSANTYVARGGRRQCRTCKRAVSDRSQRKRRADAILALMEGK